jgi:hypothetical protein
MFLAERSMALRCLDTKALQTLFSLGQVRLVTPVRLFLRR